MTRWRRFVPGFWAGTLCLLLAAGAGILWVRFTRGLGAVTNLSDTFPWGLWVGFDMLCGVGLAAGGFAITSAVYVFNIKRLKPIVRSDRAHRLPRLCPGGGRAALRPRPALEHLAPARDVEPTLGHVRGVVVRDPLSHRALARDERHGVRAAGLDACPRRPEGGRRPAGDRGCSALHPAPVVAGLLLPDRAHQAPRPLVHPDAARDILPLGLHRRLRGRDRGVAALVEGDGAPPRDAHPHGRGAGAPREPRRLCRRAGLRPLDPGCAGRGLSALA